jgi:hypothetical protein
MWETVLLSRRDGLVPDLLGLRVAMWQPWSQQGMIKMNLSTEEYSDIESSWIFEPFALSSKSCARAAFPKPPK